jgi:hypothetical protein
MSLPTTPPLSTKPTTHERNEAVRQRLIAIRRRFIELLAASPPQPNQAVFHTGVLGTDALSRFIEQLRTHQTFAGVRTLEMLPAGRYLQDVTRTELKALLPADNWNTPHLFVLENGAEFSASINGFWRHLSALYAKACAGRVHVLVSHDRAVLHKKGLEFWAAGHRASAVIYDLKVWGFVEFPILAGALSKNRGVTAIDIYVEAPPGTFTRLESRWP